MLGFHQTRERLSEKQPFRQGLSSDSSKGPEIDPAVLLQEDERESAQQEQHQDETGQLPGIEETRNPEESLLRATLLVPAAKEGSDDRKEKGFTETLHLGIQQLEGL